MPYPLPCRGGALGGMTHRARDYHSQEGRAAKEKHQLAAGRARAEKLGGERVIAEERTGEQESGDGVSRSPMLRAAAVRLGQLQCAQARN